MKNRTYRYFVGDFETSVYEGQETTEVWASALVELYTEDVVVLSSIDSTFAYLSTLCMQDNILVYYHNLKFDGVFWIDWLLRQKNFTLAGRQVDENTFEWKKSKDMKNYEYKYLISSFGQWYSIEIRLHNHYLTIRDSLKLIPFSVKEIGKAFETKHKKLDIEYHGERHAGHKITDKEKAYISNDVLVVKEGLETMFNEGHTELTIGSCCLKEYKDTIKHCTCKKGDYIPVMEWTEMFPRLDKRELDPQEYGSSNADEYIRKSYHGGWCYNNKTGIFHNGITLDVNSLYPSMMSSESLNPYPIGLPYFGKGEPKHYNDRYFFIRFRCKFELKDKKLPTVQIKKSPYYKSTEWLKTSDFYFKGEYYDTIEISKTGEVLDSIAELTMTETDFILFTEHYNIYDFEPLDYCWFSSDIGIFDTYINKYKKIKMESKGAKRTLAKLYLNNLYGKMATSTDSSFKVCKLEDDIVKYENYEERGKNPVYIPVGSAITSYSRNFTIRAAQKNYDNFIYADTDSLHLACSIDDVKGVKIDDKEFCCWKHENSWKVGSFIRQKTYIEDDDIKCAGMPIPCKIKILEMLNSGEIKIEDIKQGFKVDGKLIPKRIHGGIVLQDTSFEIR